MTALVLQEMVRLGQCRAVGLVRNDGVLVLRVCGSKIHETGSSLLGWGNKPHQSQAFQGLKVIKTLIWAPFLSSHSHMIVITTDRYKALIRQC